MTGTPTSSTLNSTDCWRISTSLTVTSGNGVSGQATVGRDVVDLAELVVERVDPLLLDDRCGDPLPLRGTLVDRDRRPRFPVLENQLVPSSRLRSR